MCHAGSLRRHRPFGSYFLYLDLVPGRRERSLRASCAYDEPGCSAAASRSCVDRLLPLAAPEQEQAEVEADDRGAREDAGERPEAENACTGFAFVNRPTAAAVRAIGVVRSELRGSRELPLGRERPLEAPERGAVHELRPSVRLRGGAARARRAAAPRGSFVDRARRPEVEHEVRQARDREARVQESSALTPYGESAPTFAASLPRGDRVCVRGRPSSRRCRGGAARRRSPDARPRALCTVASPSWFQAAKAEPIRASREW